MPEVNRVEVAAVEAVQMQTELEAKVLMEVGSMEVVAVDVRPTVRRERSTSRTMRLQGRGYT